MFNGDAKFSLGNKCTPMAVSIAGPACLSYTGYLYMYSPAGLSQQSYQLTWLCRVLLQDLFDVGHSLSNCGMRAQELQSL